jgi:DNA-binding CsgD family transcriptional regulator
MALARGYRVLSAIDVDADKSPFGSLRAVLPQSLVDHAALPSVQATALLGATRDHGPTAPPEPFLVGMALLTALAHASSSQPVALLLDDAHHMDDQSKVAFSFVGRRLSADAVVLVLASRPTPSGQLRIEGSIDLTLRPLGVEAAEMLLDVVGEHLDDDTRVEVRRASRGNPLALTELSRTWTTRHVLDERDGSSLSVGEHLRASFAGSYQQLDQPSRDLLLVAAVDGHASLDHIIEAASALNGDQVSLDVLNDAAAAGLINPALDRITFRHPLVGAAVLELETAQRLRHAHAALAEALVGTDSRRALLHRARSAATFDATISEELAHAGQEASARSDVPTAIALLQDAAALTRASTVRGHRMLQAATLAYELGDRAMVERLVKSALGEALGPLDTIRASWLAEIFTGNEAREVGRIDELRADAEAARDAGDLELAWNVLMSAASRCYWTMPDRSTAQKLAATAQALPAQGVEHRLVFALSGIDQVAHIVPVLDQCEGALERGVTDANALRMFAMGAVVVGDAPLARVFVDDAERRLRSEGRLGLLSHVLLTRIQADWAVGDWDRAQFALDEGRRLAEETGQLTWRNSARLNEARLAVVRGETDSIESTLDQIQAEASRQGTTSFLPRIQVVRGMASVSRGEHEQAFAALRRVFEPDDPLHDPRSTYPALIFLAEAALATDNVALARALIAGIRTAVGATPPLDFRVLEGLATAMLVENDEAEPAYLEVLSGEAVRWPWVMARGRLAYGTWLRRQRREADAVVQLKMAMRGLTRLGATPWLDQAKAHLRAAGAPVEPAAASPRSLLSAQELQIASLAAAGLSNREIAQRLFLSPRTVGSHLYRIFPKLGVTSRMQLAAAMDVGQD